MYQIIDDDGTCAKAYEAPSAASKAANKTTDPMS